MSYGRSWLFVWCASGLFLINLLHFLVGYFPFERTLPGVASSTDAALPYALCGLPSNTVHDTTYAPLHGHLVLLVVDALRYDFVDFENFPYVSVLLNSRQGLKYRSRAFAPTVTLPRIKSILSGVVPGYADIIVNLDASRMSTDNVIYQAHSQLKRSYFFGDDTWLKLFPAEYFSKYEGTTSFYVNDYTEVDTNVTRNVKASLQAREEWDFLFLHYLGLDHLGHIVGPDSPLVADKLKEMDEVIELLHKKLPPGSLIVVTGDHGMSVTGNHGGTSHEEIETPILFLLAGNERFAEQDASTSSLSGPSVYQIDIAPTLSLLMGLPVPRSSCGSVLPEVLVRHPRLNADQRLFRMQYNAHQLLQVFSENFEAEMEKYQSVRATICNYLRLIRDDQPLQSEAVESSQRGLHSSMMMMKKMLIASRSRFSLHALITGVVGAAHCALAVLVCAFAENLHFQFDRRVLLSSFILGFSTSAFISTLLAGATLPTELVSLAFLSTSTYVLLCSLQGFGTAAAFKAHVLGGGVSLLSSMQLMGLGLHAGSLVGSSFVEEEHQTWYFLSVTIGVAGALLAPSMKIGKEELIKVCRVLLLSRILRGWNRTGDKWIHLPVYADYVLRQPALASALILVTAHNAIGMFRMRNSQLQGAITGTAAGFILLYKLYSVHAGEHPSVAVWLYLALPIALVAGIWEFVTQGEALRERHLHPLNSVSNCWMLLGFILQRPENVFMFGLEIFLENAVHLAVGDFPVTVRAVIYMWFSNAAFFHQGNSNKLSTIDVASGYIGVSFYEPVLVGLLMYCHTYSGVIHWLVMFWRRACYNLGPKDKLRVTSLVLCIKLLVTTWYLIVMLVHREHIFVWSVFSPKGLYESAHAATTVMVLMAVSACNV
ncbi:GPI ethanolamine phosphate transferase 2-like [Tropilaelaps mercedesae]|uniref:GPI ethanolamine phosphate transferase 2-like n=1 Tax=Tropilaelaps mercedesae TaxID=418985 RepID=A0A1V9XZ47_9ACAR|nr:GPI ethanolamine phosphate transferase 2-like [Tropilaelaps mercedesae]